MSQRPVPPKSSAHYQQRAQLLKREAAELAAALEKHRLQISNERIAEAKATLKSTFRGCLVLVDLRIFLTAPDGVSGLDSAGGAAVLALVREFVTNHRRGF